MKSLRTAFTDRQWSVRWLFTIIGLAVAYGIWAFFNTIGTPIQAFDEGITTGSAVALSQGSLAVTDFYSPYGVLFGFLGAIPRWLGVDGVWAGRLMYDAGRAFCTILGTTFLWRRYGWRAGLLGVLAFGAVGVGRYSYSWALIFAGLILLDAFAGRTQDKPGLTLAQLAKAKPWKLVAVIFVLSLPGWVRLEYAVVAGMFGVVLWIMLRGRDRWLWLAVAWAFALLPTALIIITGSGQHLIWWLEYALGSGFRENRGQPIVWNDLRLATPSAKVTTLAYGGAFVSIVVAVVAACTKRGRRWFVEDGSGVRILAVLLCAIILRAQLVRYSDSYAALGTPILLLPFILLIAPWLQRASFPKAAGALVICAILLWPLFWGGGPRAAYHQWQARDGHASERDAITGLDHIALPVYQWPGWAADQSEWTRLGLDGKRTVVINTRNDQAWANPIFLNTLVRARPATWLWSYDPGLSNQERVQREAARQLCANQAPIFQAPYVNSAPPPAGPKAAQDSLSTYLDEFVALSYTLSSAPSDRILEFQNCVLPDKTTAGVAAAARDRWLKAGEINEAAHAARTHLRLSKDDNNLDLGLIAASDLPLPKDAKIQPGPLAIAVRALIDKKPVDGVVKAAMNKQLTPAEAWVAMQAALLYGGPKQPRTAAMVEAANRNFVALPTAATLEQLKQLQPFDPTLWKALYKQTDESPVLLPWWVQGQVGAGQPAEALKYVPQLDRWFRDQGRVLELGGTLKELSEAIQPSDPDCGNALRKRAYDLPGTWFPHPPPASSACPAISRLPT